MPIEAFIWLLVLVLGPGLAHRFWPQFRSRLPELHFELEALAPWIHSLGLPYLAIILGSVSGRQVGLQDLDLDRWIVGILAGALGWLAVYGLLPRLDTQPDPEQSFSGIFLEESRWAFYRGAAVLWLPFPFSALAGLGVALLELALTHLFRHGRKFPTSAQLKTLMRLGFSTLIFIATRNFYLTVGLQLLLTWVLIRQNQPIDNA
jgi:hypothetical protein